jgi:hypothetical protein
VNTNHGWERSDESPRSMTVDTIADHAQEQLDASSGNMHHSLLFRLINKKV